MADRWGALAIPTETQGTGESIGDPLLQRLLSFLVTFLRTDENAKIAWASIAKDRPHAVVDAFSHNPEEGKFSTKTLPALYMWRSDMREPKQIAADWRTQESVLQLRWVLHDVAQDRQVERMPNLNMMAKAIDLALQRKRTPSFILQDDTDPNASVFGSFVLHHLGVMRIRSGRAKPSTIEIQPFEKGVAKTKYRCLSLEILVEERLNRDLDRFSTLDGVTGSVQQNGLTLYTYQLRLTVRSITPNTGPAAGGTSVTILGTGFNTDETPTVTIGGAEATSVEVLDANVLTCTTPAGTAGARDVVVTNPRGETATLAAAFTYS